MKSNRFFIGVLGSCLLVAALALTDVHTLSAQGVWSPPFNIGNGAVFYAIAGRPTPLVAVNPNGDAVVAWKDAPSTVESVIRAAVFTASSGTLSPVTGLTPAGGICQQLQADIDGAGNAFVIWSGAPGGLFSNPVGIQVSRFDRATASWSPVQFLETGAGLSPQITVDDAGNALAIWWARINNQDVLRFARLVAGTSTWTPAATFAVNANDGPQLAGNAMGEAIVAWEVGEGASSRGHAKRFQASTGTWVGEVVLSPTERTANLSVAINASGSGIVVWSRGSDAVVEGSRYTAGGGWVSFTGLSAPSILDGNVVGTTRPSAALSDAGDAIVAWTQHLALFGVLPSIAQAAAYRSDTSSWSPTVTLSPPGGFASAWDAVVNRQQAFVAWSDYTGSGATLRAVLKVRRYDFERHVWDSGSVSLATASFGLTGAQLAMGPGESGFAVWHRATGRDVDAIPIVQIARFQDFGPASAPTLLPVVVNRPSVALTWQAGSQGPPPSAYTLLASLSPGGPPIVIAPLGLATSTTAQAPDGTYYVRVVATVLGQSVESNEIRVDVAPGPPPGAPQNLGFSLGGNTLTLTWTGSPGAHAYVVEAGSAPGLANIAVVNTASPAASLTVPGVPNGRYFIRVRAANGNGMSAPTDDVDVVITMPPPPPPVMQSPVISGATVRLAWSGPAAATYTLLVRVTPNGPVLISAPVGAITGLTVPGVATGTYYVTAVASVGGQAGAESNQMLVLVR